MHLNGTCQWISVIRVTQNLLGVTKPGLDFGSWSYYTRTLYYSILCHKLFYVYKKSYNQLICGSKCPHLTMPYHILLSWYFILTKRPKYLETLLIDIEIIKVNIYQAISDRIMLLWWMFTVMLFQWVVKNVIHNPLIPHKE